MRVLATAAKRTRDAVYDEEPHEVGPAAPGPRGVLRSRRSHVVPGLVATLGGLLLLQAARLPWIRVQGVPVSLLSARARCAVDPHCAGGSSGDARHLARAAGIAVVVAGVLLLCTRVRGLALLWRLCAMTGTALPAVVFLRTWQAVRRSPLEVLSDPSASFLDKLEGALRGAAEALGVVHVEPSHGLYLGAMGLGVVVLGCLLPGRPPSRARRSARGEAGPAPR